MNSLSHLAGRLVAGMLLAATAPLALLIAGLVRLDVGAPVMFRQTRCGRDGDPFTILKFRTMRDSLDASGSPLPDAARVTPLGIILRRTRLDEWPQLVCILRGDLAWIGPRPLLPDTITSFGEMGRLRCQIRPGLTGWAQVNGNTRLGDPSKLALDLWYVEHRSPALDFRILIRTVATLVRGERIDARRINEAMGFARALGRREVPS